MQSGEYDVSDVTLECGYTPCRHAEKVGPIPTVVMKNFQLAACRYTLRV